MPTAASSRHLSWDLFCRVVDNFGDVGVCWRLARELVARGARVRLWIDDPRALAWMAPAGHAGVEVRPWAEAAAAAPADVVIEAFGCDPDPGYVAAMAAASRPPLWLNLEYLSAEVYVERSHGLASPQFAGPGRGLMKWFFYPGFTARTGGLLREQGLVEARAAFVREDWLRARGLGLAPGERLVSLFCYEAAPVARLVDALATDACPTVIATAPGAATALARAVLACAPAHLRQVALPWLAQDDFDRLLWSCDLNFVRGEDSWVRAQWACQTFVWQAYPQADGAHATKVEAFLDLALAAAPPAAANLLRAWFRAWNGVDDPANAAPLPAWTPAALDAATRAARAWRDELLAGPELVAALLAFVQEKL